MRDDRSEQPDGPPLEDWVEAGFRDALRRLDVPETSVDFDARVLAAVRGRSPWWELVLSALRPALATAACSAAVTMVLLYWPLPAPDAGRSRTATGIVAPSPGAWSAAPETFVALAPLRHAARERHGGPAVLLWKRLLSPRG